MWRSRAQRRESRRAIFSCAVVLVATCAWGDHPAHAAEAGAGYTALSPARLLDTRPGGTTADGAFSGGGLRPFDTTLTLTVAGRAGVPSGAASVALNITVTEPQGAGFLTAYPCDAPRPTASNLNYAHGQTVANLVVSRLSADGSVCLYTLGATHLIVDVAGFFMDAQGLKMLPAPARLLDTRPDLPTVDGQFAGTGQVMAGATQQVVVIDRASIPTGISSVVLNVAVAAPLDAGYVSVHPCDTARTITSNLNYAAGQTVANSVVVRVPASGAICLFSSATTDLVVDVSGYFADNSVLTPLAAPARLLDTRPGMPTSDGQSAGTGLRPAGGTIDLKIGTRAGIPSSVTAVVLNITATEPVAAGFVTAYPRGIGRPLASNLNFGPAQNVANAVIAPIGVGGSVCLFTNVATHLVVDVVGYITGPQPGLFGPYCPTDPGMPPLPPIPIPILPTVPVPVPTWPPAPVPIAPGSYVIGAGLSAGRYTMTDAQSGCSWQRRGWVNGAPSVVLGAHTQDFAGQAVADIAYTDTGFVFSAECGAMYIEYSSLAAQIPRIKFTAGTYMGRELWRGQGRYWAYAQPGCSWAILSSFSGEATAVKTQNTVSTPGWIALGFASNEVGFSANPACGEWEWSLV